MNIFICFSQLFQRFRRQRPQQPPDEEAGPQGPQPRGLALEMVHNHVIDLANIIVYGGLPSASAVALTYAQIHSKYSPIFHVLSFEILLCFAFLLVGNFMNSRFLVIAQVLDLAGVFFGVTAFFTAISIPFPPCLQIITWVVYGFTLLSVFYSILF
jgi:hypothetical protein